MIAVVPGYISRSVAGSYDNEGMQKIDGHNSVLINTCGIDCLQNSSTLFCLGIAIFCMLLTYYMWIKAVKSGSVYWSSICALAYFYMVRRSEEGFTGFILTLGVLLMCLCPGFLLGWLRVLDQPNPTTRPGSDAHRPVLSPYLRGLLHSLLPGHHPLHADFVRWFPSKAKWCHMRDPGHVSHGPTRKTALNCHYQSTCFYCFVTHHLCLSSLIT